MPFVTLGGILEKAVRDTKSQKRTHLKIIDAAESAEIEAILNSLSNSIFEIGREIYSKLEYLNTERLDEDQFVQQVLEKQKFEDLTVRQLFKAVITSKHSHQFF